MFNLSSLPVNAEGPDTYLKKTDYGTGGDATAYFKWVQDKNGDYSLEKTENEQEAQITVHYDADKNTREKINNETKEINQGFVDLSFDGTSQEQGGAVYNNAFQMENVNIKGDFIRNRVEADGNAQGGAIANMWGSIGNIEGDFIGNYTYSKAGSQGGAIANVYSTMGNIKGNFIGNYAYSDNGDYVLGGAITNDGIDKEAKIGNIEGNFAYNYARSINGWVRGGAIFNGNKAEIESIKGDFIGNYTKNETNSDNKSEGGAIANVFGTIGDITGNFIGNYTYSEGYALGGAIMSYDSKIGDIEGNFAYNYAYSTNGYASGGAIKNDGYGTEGERTIGDITGNFIENYAKGKVTASGGAVFNENDAKIGNITGNFIKNYAKSDQDAHGGAIYNYTGASIGNITGDFIGNYSSAESDISHGGAIDNRDSTIGNITGDFIENYSQGANDSFGGAIYNYNTAEYSSSTIGDLKGDFIGNRAISSEKNATGGAIYNQGAKIGNIEGNFSSNSANGKTGGQGGALANTGETGNIHGDFVSNSASSLGGAVYNAGKIGEADNKGIYNSSFYNNTAGTHGGAIYTEKSLKLTADGYVSEFADNKANGESEAIYVGKADDVTLTLSAKKSGKFNFFDTINGEVGYNLAITGDEAGEVNLYNNILNADITHKDVTTNAFDVKFLNNSNSLDMQSGTLNINNFGLTQLNFRKFDIQGGTINIDSVDVNLADKVMGRIKAESYETSSGGTINVNDMKVLSDSTDLVTPVNFADASFAGTVHSPVNKAYGPIYQYGVDYLTGAATKTSSIGSTGDFLFTRIGFNPAILASPVAQLTGGYASMVQTYNYAFEHADTFSALPASVRKAMLNQNKYAITEGNLPLYNNHLNKNALWFRPYTSFESIPLKNGPKTSTVLYGSYIGGDTEVFHLKNGWDSVYSGYIGYTGASQSYQGNHTYQNGIVGGITDTFYKNNFYTALTASVGSSIGETTTMYGSEDFTMLMGGVASKTGYNFEFNDGRFIIQPNLLLSYTFINTFDYTNAANVRINAEPLHALQVHPYVKFIQNTESGWQPYLAGGFVYNVMGQTQIRVADLYGNNVELPALSIKPYAEYGLGIQKLWNDKYTGFLQAMARSGGRNGIAFTMGFRIALGDDGKKIEKVKTDDNIKTVSNVTKTEKSKKVKAEKPARVKTEKPSKIKAEKPVKVETKVPEKVQTNEIILKTEVIQPAVKTEAGAKVETPAKIKTKTLAKSQQPDNEEHHSFIYNWMLKFSNFFCQPSAAKTTQK